MQKRVLTKLLPNGPRLSLRSYLLGLVMVALVPAFGVGAVTAYMMHRDLRHSFETRLMGTADAVAIAVDPGLSHMGFAELGEEAG